jgi:YD repeat-containing protein
VYITSDSQVVVVVVVVVVLIRHTGREVRQYQYDALHFCTEIRKGKEECTQFLFVVS